MNILIAKYKISPNILSDKIRHFEGVSDKEPCIDIIAGAIPENDEI